jgi:hypothetical protein
MNCYVTEAASTLSVGLAIIGAGIVAYILSMTWLCLFPVQASASGRVNQTLGL